MGFTKSLSWSISCSKMLKECPRQAFYQYYSRGEKDIIPDIGQSLDQRSYALRDMVSIQMAAGAAIDYVIAWSLRSLRDEGQVKKDLAKAGTRFFESQFKNSLSISTEIKVGGRWDRSSGTWQPPLLHHYYGFDLGKDYENEMRDRVAKSFKNFEGSEIWARIKESPPTTWHPLTRLDDVPTPSFRTAGGLTIYANIDFAFGTEAGATVFDWKSGNRSTFSEGDTTDQLSMYAIWAMKHFKARQDAVAVQAVWLDSKPTWSPTSVSRDAMGTIATRAKSEHQDELDRVQVISNPKGRPLRYEANIEDFEAKPKTNRCVQCKFLELCPDGRSACSHIERKELVIAVSE